MRVKYNKSNVTSAMNRLRVGIQTEVPTSLKLVLDQAARDAQAIKSWRDPGQYTEQYGNTEISWEVTGMAQASIQAYIVGQKRLNQQPDITTTSTINGVPLQHQHRTDDGVTGNYAARNDVIAGVVTMNVAYAPYLQDWEQLGGGDPVIVEVMDINWVPVYVPRLRNEIENRMRKYSTR